MCRLAAAAYPCHYPRFCLNYRRFYQDMARFDFIGAGSGTVLGVCQSFPAARAEFLPLRRCATGYLPDEGLGLRLSADMGNDNQGLFIFLPVRFGRQCGRYCFGFPVMAPGGKNPDHPGRPGHRPAFILGCPRLENPQVIIFYFVVIAPDCLVRIGGLRAVRCRGGRFSADLFHFPD